MQGQVVPGPGSAQRHGRMMSTLLPPGLCIAPGQTESSLGICEVPAPLIKAIPCLLLSFHASASDSGRAHPLDSSTDTSTDTSPFLRCN